MRQPKVLALILAGGSGGRMELLTERRAKPVLPFAGIYHLIDFPLSHCVHSQIDDVWVVEQFQPHSLNDHLANGRPWDLDRTYGGLRILPPHTGTGGEGFAQGNADALYRNLPFLREFAPDLLLVLSSDHIYRLDYRDVIAAHSDSGADVTLVTTKRPIEQASRHGVVQVDTNNRVTDFAYKPKQPQSDLVTAEIFVYSFVKFAEMLEKLAQKAGDEGLKDYGDSLLPAFVAAGNVTAFPLKSYWRDVGTIEAYWQAHMDLLLDPPPLALDDAAWPIYTFGIQRLPARIWDGSHVTNSLIAPGCQIHGVIEHSVLGPGVVVEAGASVRDSILFTNVRVAANATVAGSIIDEQAVIGERATVGAPPNQNTPELTLIGQNVHIAAHKMVAAGARIDAESSNTK